MTNLRHLPRLFRIYSTYALRKGIQVGYAPYRLWIEPSSKCNLRCRMCANKDMAPEQVGMMETGLFEKVIDEAADFVHDINIHHRGESLLNKRLFEMIRYAKRKGVVVKLHTNATVLNREKASKVLESGLDLISFSFDGTDEETYERYRVGARFDRTLENITGFLSMKRERGAKAPWTVLELIDFTESDSDYRLERLSEFKRRFEGLPLDRLIVKRPHNFGGNIDLDTIGDSTVYSPCTYLWHSLVVLWNGDVTPCTQDFHAELVLGNVRDNTLREIFNGERLTALRGKAVAGTLAETSPCRNCDMIRRKRLFGIPVDSLRFLEK